MNKFFIASAALAMALTISACDNRNVAPRSDLPAPTTTNPGSSPNPGSPTAEAATDTATTAKVKAALLAADSVSSTKISVETRDGRVMLKGTLPDRAMIDRVLAAVQSIPGVRAVDNQLSVGAG
jgi:hyperosmotically inducible periplasmic protein